MNALLAMPAQPDRRGQAPRASVLERGGFTLIEMLVVLGIIAVILAVAMPNVRGFQEGAAMESATRQLIADLGLGRARAINSRTTVAMVFIPEEIQTLNLSGFKSQEVDEIRRLQAGPYTQYALFAARRVGDQPGRATPRYITEWKTLPDKTFIAQWKFPHQTPMTLPQFEEAEFPFPFETSSQKMKLPYVAFDFEGRLCQADGSPLLRPEDIAIPLARGAVLYTRAADNSVVNFSIQEVPPQNSLNTPNHVVLDWLTGRAHLVRLEL